MRAPFQALAAGIHAVMPRCAAILALLIITPLASAQAPLTVTLTMHDYPPFIGPDLPHGGLLTHIVVESFKAANVKVRLERVPSNRAITGVMLGMYDGTFGWAHTPERARKLLYSRTSIYTFRMVFFQRRAMEIDWDTLADLKSYQIGATLGDHYSDEFARLQARRVLQVQESASDVGNMRKLLVGRIDLFPMEEVAGQMLIRTSLTPAEQARLTHQSRAIATVPTYLVLRKDLPHAQELLDRFEQGYRQFSESGQLAKAVKEMIQ